MRGAALRIFVLDSDEIIMAMRPTIERHTTIGVTVYIMPPAARFPSDLEDFVVYDDQYVRFAEPLEFAGSKKRATLSVHPPDVVEYVAKFEQMVLRSLPASEYFESRESPTTSVVVPHQRKETHRCRRQLGRPRSTSPTSTTSSDFGRAATLRLLHKVADVERDIVRRLTGHDFYDEYRRIMFTCVADLGYIKSDTIRGYADRRAPLDRDVLYGTGHALIPGHAVEAIADVLAGPIAGALERGYPHIRVVVPCNTLAQADDELIRYLEKRVPGVPISLYGRPAPETGPRVVILSVPRAGAEPPARQPAVGAADQPDADRHRAGPLGLPDGHLRHGRAQHRRRRVHARRAGRDGPLVAASIDGDRSEIESLVETVEDLVSNARQTSQGSLEVVQASTDLSIGVGSESLQMLARQLVLDAYRPALR